MKFDIVWEDCIHEKDTVANIEYLLREDDQALSIHTKGTKKSNFKKGSHKPSKNMFQKRRVNHKKDYSNYQCYNYHKIGHLAGECPLQKKSNNKRQHSHLDKNEK